MGKKLLAFVLCAALACAALGIAACAPEAARSSYQMALEYTPETRTLAGEMTADIVGTGEDARPSLTFQLWANAFREGAKYAPVTDLFAPAAYYGGESYGGITVHSVEGARSFCVTGEDENLLEVVLDEPLLPGERVQLTMSFTVLLAEVNHRLGAGERVVTLSGFYPALCAGEGRVYSALGDPFMAECADFEATLTLPEGYVAACTGEGERTLSDGKAVYHVRAEGVREIAFLCSEHFQTVQTEAVGVPVTYYYLDDPSPERTLLAAARALAYYSENFGQYACGQYSVAEADFPYGGMEYPMLSLLAADLTEAEIPLVAAHETAHQWWYAAVGSDQFAEPWQDEALAEYSAALFLEACPEYGRDYATCVASAEGAYRSFFSAWSQIADASQTSMRRPLTAFQNEYEYRSVVYDKGLILFDRLDGLLGREKMLAALREYYREYAGMIAPPEALIACFTRRGRSAEGVFSSFLEGTCVI